MTARKRPPEDRPDPPFTVGQLVCLTAQGTNRPGTVGELRWRGAPPTGGPAPGWIIGVRWHGVLIFCQPDDLRPAE